MAPHSFGVETSLDISSSVASWLGTIFTGVGLVAVYAQLRSFIGNTYSQQERWMKRSAGDWRSCFDKQVLDGEGYIEQAAPAFAGWIQKRYLDGDSTKLTQADNFTSGTCSWSRLFSQCSIWAGALQQDGGRAAFMHPVTSSDTSDAWKPTQADIRKEDGRLMYGFSCAEFSALMLLGGFPPDRIGDPGISNSTCYLGTMYLADHGSFSQFAHFDPHAGCKTIKSEVRRHVHSVPVQGILHVALGILKVSPKRGGRQWIVFPTHSVSLLKGGESSPRAYEYWTHLPKSTQLNRIRYNLEQLVNLSVGGLFNYATQSREDFDTESALMRNMVGQECKSGSLPFHEALLVAYALDALVPWPVLPVAPRHLVYALSMVLAPFVASREETVELLCERIQGPSFSSPKKPPRADGWANAEEQAEAIDRTGSVKTDYFSGSADNCKYYYDAMEMVFEDSNISLDQVRKVFAAEAAWQILYPESKLYESIDEKDVKGRKQYMARMLSHLHRGTMSAPIDVPNIDWALKIYATFLWGWLHDSLETDGEFLGKFKRRVFLG